MHCIEDFFSDCEGGLQQFTGLAKSMLATLSDSRWTDIVPDDFYREPLLFASIAACSIEDIPQIVFGYIPPDRRPPSIPVETNNDGVIFIPKLGYLITENSNEKMTVNWDSETNAMSLASKQGHVPFKLAPVLAVPGSSIRITLTHHRLIEDMCGKADKEQVRPPAAMSVASDCAALCEAAEVLKTAYPAYWNLIKRCTIEIVPFSNPEKNSFASLASYGTSFINVLEKPSTSVFFVEDLAHQCGHLALSAIAYDAHRFLCNPESLLKTFTGSDREHRTLLTALHGLFTEALMAKTLDLCLSQNVFAGRDTDECLGRLAFITAKLNNDLRYMNIREIYTSDGLRLYECTLNVCASVLSRRANEMSKISLAGQSYTFSTNVFFANNIQSHF